MEPAQLDQLCVNTLRTLSIDAVQKAGSGHPGTPMDAAPTVYCLWQRFLRYDPDDPLWIDRDRFVLSAGHACALLYSLLHLCQVKARGSSYPADSRFAVSMEDLQSFRQAGSHCTGHPEYGWTTGIEVTTGPLGQGAAVSVGMAISQQWLANTYNRPGQAIFKHKVYAFCSDGDMMEGISGEAASIAGHLHLSNLCWIYDDNHITIEGSTALTFTENVETRFQAYGWRVERIADANDLSALSAAYQRFQEVNDCPTLIIVHSHIGYGAPDKHDSAAAHGEPLGEAEVRAAKIFYGCDPDRQFYVPDGVIKHFHDHIGQRGSAANASWKKAFAQYQRHYPDLAEQIEQIQMRELPAGWSNALPTFATDTKGLSTRDASGQVLNAVAARLPWLLGGAADLSPSTKTRLTSPTAGDFQASGQAAPGDYKGRNFHFGLREHAMCAIGNGLSLTGLRPFVSSFLIFTDYCRAALRLSAMMELPLIGIWTHDSISLGEDGPTHQPIEHLASLRAMPGMVVLRPADANEVVESWRVILQLEHTPACLVLTRQAVPTLDRSKYASASGVALGGYVMADPPHGDAEVLLLASGSEVALALLAYEQLTDEGIKARVVSLPCWELFEHQPQDYRDSVLPPSVSARVAVEEASTFGWERYVGQGGAVIGLHTFGMSAPLQVVARHFGFSPEHVVQAARAQIAQQRAQAGARVGE